jgi:DNA-binding Lrp family transcriptional regulator
MLKKKILRILEKDARMTPDQIATMTGASVDEVTRIIRQAEEERAIIKYKALINWDKLGNDHVMAFIEVKIAPQRDVGFDAIAERIYKFEEARTVYLMSGTFDLLVLVAGKSMHEVSDFVTQKLAPIEGVTATASYFLLKRYKEDGEIFYGKDELDRQAVIL